jgi:hypothetical protein
LNDIATNNDDDVLANFYQFCIAITSKIEKRADTNRSITTVRMQSEGGV